MKNKVKKFDEFINENRVVRHEDPYSWVVKIKGKKVDVKSLEIGGIDMKDFPNFSDAYIVSGKFENGKPLSKKDIDYLNQEYYELISSLAYEQIT